MKMLGRITMKVKINNGKRLFVTSDLHFYHANIIKFQKNRSDRWSYVDDMNAGLIQLWNKKVGPEDSVVIVGDFSFGTPEQTKNIFDQLNGKKYLVFGNHDSREKLQHCVFEAVSDVMEFKYNGKSFFCSHYAHKVWNKSHYGTYHLYGHSHGSLPDDPTALSMDVGIDNHPNMEPFSFDEIVAKMKTKTFVPVDHHNRYTT